MRIRGPSWSLSISATAVAPHSSPPTGRLRLDPTASVAPQTIGLCISNVVFAPDKPVENLSDSVRKPASGAWIAVKYCVSWPLNFHKHVFALKAPYRASLLTGSARPEVALQILFEYRSCSVLLRCQRSQCS